MKFRALAPRASTICRSVLQSPDTAERFGEGLVVAQEILISLPVPFFEKPSAVLLSCSGSYGSQMFARGGHRA
jgi:hypothetical protein